MKTDTILAVLKDIAVAFSLLTRLPLPHLPAHAFARSAQAVWAYPLAGTVVGAIAALGGSLAMLLGLPATLAAGIVLMTMALVTGAMHEDGLSDVADGFWGAMSPNAASRS